MLKCEECNAHTLLSYDTLPLWLQKVLDLFFFEHYLHLLELGYALVFYNLCWPFVFSQAAALTPAFFLSLLAYNALVMLSSFGLWHLYVFHGPHTPALRSKKFNPINQYEGVEGSANLRREVFYTSLGMLQSTALQALGMWMFATGRAPYYADFWSAPAFSLLTLFAVNLWRTSHFYFVHRFMHPWGWKVGGVDIGLAVYNAVHSLHHKSREFGGSDIFRHRHHHTLTFLTPPTDPFFFSENPGPWAGLSMHPVEHLLYYSCCWPMLLLRFHPLVFLFAKFHADVSPVGGHDGHEDPGGGGMGYHWLHHHRFEVNFGVPTIDFDRIFGNFVDPKAFAACGGDLEKARRLTQLWDRARGWGPALATLPGPEALGEEGKKAKFS